MLSYAMGAGGTYVSLAGLRETVVPTVPNGKEAGALNSQVKGQAGLQGCRAGASNKLVLHRDHKIPHS